MIQNIPTLEKVGGVSSNLFPPSQGKALLSYARTISNSPPKKAFLTLVVFGIALLIVPSVFAFNIYETTGNRELGKATIETEYPYYIDINLDTVVVNEEEGSLYL